VECGKRRSIDFQILPMSIFRPRICDPDHTTLEEKRFSA
jgi:hypothetical protein